MPHTKDKRERLIEAAKVLIHQQGFKQTTLADIAREAEVPLGNVYYYFKTKDDIAAAVIDAHSAEFQVRAQGWDGTDDPRQRLLAFLDLPSDQREAVVSHGCPVGSLCQELNKERTALADKADALIQSQVKWSTEQFRLMNRPDAPALGQQFIATLQGITLLAQAMHDEDVLRQQIERLKDWLRAL